MRDVAVYIDESGAHGFNFDKEGVTKYYVITLVIVPLQNAPGFEESLKICFSKFSQSGYIKSSDLKKYPEKRKKILEELSNISFHYFSLIVDKTKIHTDSGLQYKKSFYKYFQKLCYQRLISFYDNIHIYSDTYGYEEFQESFINYIKKNYNTYEFFKTLDIKFVSKNYGTQLSDIIAGTIRSHFSGELDQSYLNIIEHKSLSRIVFPVHTLNKIITQKSVPDLYNNGVESIAIKKAEEYFSLSDKSTNEEAIHAKAVLEILYHKNFMSDSSYLSSKEIIEHLKEYYDLAILDNDLKQRIIPYLRDHDVIIVSSSKGYKLPTTLEDLHDYIEMMNKNIIPALKRLNKTINYVQFSILEEYKILDTPRFNTMKKLLEVIEN